MKNVSAATTAAWKSRLKAGPTRPHGRVTIQEITMRTHPYNTEDAPGGDYDHHRSRVGHFASILFGQEAPIREMFNVRRISWARSTDQDIAEATVTLLNTDIVALGDATGTNATDFELPGLFTFSRGTSQAAATRWGYGETGWSGVLVPDRLVRTYEGYGIDETKAPGDDPNMYLSGTWLIEDVDYNANGDVEIKLLDVGRLFRDAISFPPIVPRDDYPMEWDLIGTDQVEGRDCKGGSWQRPPWSGTSSSNDAYVGKGIVDNPAYVDNNGSVQGHRNRDPLVGDEGAYWLSTGQESPESFVWWEEALQGTQNVSGVRIQTKGGPFRIYISLRRADGTWYSKKTIPYEVTTAGIDNGAAVPFVTSVIADKGLPFEVTLPRKFKNVSAVRITMTRLRRDGPTDYYEWRGGLRGVDLYVGAYADLKFGKGKVLQPVGNYRDYTDIVKWCSVWAGFYWPESDQENWMRFDTAGAPVNYRYGTFDSVLPKGRAWGSFQDTGTAGVAKLTAENFDKQPLLDCITYVRNITGFSFWIDECGGVVWRMPNIYAAGNYVSRDPKLPRRGPGRTQNRVTIDEDETLLAYSTQVSSKNIRETVFVGDAMGKFGIAIRGFNPFPVNFRRIAGWTDENFESTEETIVAADLIAAQQMFSWRRSKVTIPGYPAIQIDDQVQLYERITNETYVHYVTGVSSDMDLDAGTWTYSLDTHWLGEDPSDVWAVRVDELKPETKLYLDTQGGVD